MKPITTGYKTAVMYTDFDIIIQFSAHNVYWSMFAWPRNYGNIVSMTPNRNINLYKLKPTIF